MATSYNGVRKSINGGQTWSSMNGVYGADALAIGPGSPSVIYVFTSDSHRILKSSNDGASWSDITPNLPADNLFSSFTIDPSPQHILYASGGGVWAYSAKPLDITVEMIAPYTATVGGPSLTLAVTGNGFGADAVVLWNGSALATTYISPAQLMATVPANLIVAAGLIDISVTSEGNTTANFGFAIQPLSRFDAVLYGNFGAGSGIWKWDGTTWSQVTPNAPKAMVAVRFAIVRGLWGRLRHLEMGWHNLESGYTECSDSYGSIRFAIVRELWDRRRHLEMGWHNLESGYTELLRQLWQHQVRYCTGTLGQAPASGNGMAQPGVRLHRMLRQPWQHQVRYCMGPSGQARHLEMGWHNLESGYAECSDSDGGLRFAIVWGLRGRLRHLEMGWHNLESGYTECSDRHGSIRFAIVWGLRDRRRHLEMGWHNLESGYTEQSDEPDNKLRLLKLIGGQLRL